MKQVLTGIGLAVVIAATIIWLSSHLVLADEAQCAQPSLLWLIISMMALGGGTIVLGIFALRQLAAMASS